MRIAFITYEYPTEIGLGGIGTYTQQVAQALVSKGIEVAVFCGSKKSNTVYKDGGVLIYTIKCEDPFSFKTNVVSPFLSAHEKRPYNLIESPEIHGNAEEIKRVLPDLHMVVRLHAPNYLVESLKKTYTPLFVKLRFFIGALIRGKWDLGYWRKYEKNLDQDYRFTLCADAIVAPSEAMRSWVVDNWHIDDKKITVIPNIFKAADSLSRIKRPTNYKTVIFFGRLNVLKGLVNATKAMKLFLSENPDWKWTVVGSDGPSHVIGVTMQQWMEQQLSNVISQVHFTGGLTSEELAHELAFADVALLPSLFESFSYTCIEALAAGLPVIGSKIGGMSDFIISGINGYLIDPYNVKDILFALKVIGESDNFAKRQASARDTINMFSGDILVDKYVKLYKSLT